MLVLLQWDENISLWKLNSGVVFDQYEDNMSEYGAAVELHW